MTTHNRSINDGGRIHGKYASYEGSDMDDKAHKGIRVHEKKRKW
jgi:hypothetical protein